MASPSNLRSSFGSRPPSPHNSMYEMHPRSQGATQARATNASAPSARLINALAEQAHVARPAITAMNLTAEEVDAIGEYLHQSLRSLLPDGYTPATPLWSRESSVLSDARDRESARYAELKNSRHEDVEAPPTSNIVTVRDAVKDMLVRGKDGPWSFSEFRATVKSMKGVIKNEINDQQALLDIASASILGMCGKNPREAELILDKIVDPAYCKLQPENKRLLSALLDPQHLPEQNRFPSRKMSFRSKVFLALLLVAAGAFAGGGVACQNEYLSRQDQKSDALGNHLVPRKGASGGGRGGRGRRGKFVLSCSQASHPRIIWAVGGALALGALWGMFSYAKSMMAEKKIRDAAGRNRLRFTELSRDASSYEQSGPQPRIEELA